MVKIPNRLIGLFIVSIAITIAYSSCQSNSIEKIKQQRPNIVWFVCEDQSPYWFPFYGDSTIHLPNLERLANEGIVYNNAYSPIPVCSPARSSIITGMYPTTLGTHNMRSFNPYRDGANEPSLNIPSYSVVPPVGVKPFTEKLRASGYYCSNNAKEDYNFEPLPSMWDDSSNEGHWRNREADQPFFSVVNFNITHESAIWHLGKDSLLVEPLAIPVPPIFPDDPIIRHDLAVNYSNLIRMDRKVGELIDQLEEDGLMDNTIIFFYGDHGGPFPRHKRSVYESGNRVPMVVRMPDGFGAGTRSDKLVSFIDLAPTVLSLADLEIPDVMQGQAFMGSHNSETEVEYLFATSDRFDEVYDQRRAVRDHQWKYIRNTYPDKPFAIPVAYRLNMPMMNRLIEMNKEGSLNANQKLWMRTTKPSEELYDLENDPWELNDLADHPDYSDHLKRLSTRLDKWINETGDLGQVDEQKLIQRWRPDGEQQILPAVSFQQEGDKIVLLSDRSDATIIWKRQDQEAWNIYTEPFTPQSAGMIQVQQVRIGYHSLITNIEYNL